MRYYVQCDRRQSRKAKLMRGRWRKINNPAFAKWSAIVDAHYDCFAIFQIGDANKCPEG